MQRKKVILIGGFIEIIELCENLNYEIVGIIDKKPIEGYQYLGDDSQARQVFREYGNIRLVVTPDQPSVRSNIVKYYSEIGFEFTSIISDKANISSSAKLGRGVIVQNASSISSNSIIGDFCKVNTMANVAHDCFIGEFVTLAPGCVILGYSTINHHCYIGANATILPRISIKDNCIVGAGAIVTKHFDKSGSILVGILAVMKGGIQC